MSRFLKQELPAIAMLFGGIIGAGIFAVPFTAAQAGFFVGVFYILALSLVVTLLHLFYAETVLRTSTRHRLVGYVRLYLGKGAESVQLLTAIFGIYGALLVYGIIAGQFLEVLFGGLGAFGWSLVFFGLSFLVVLFNLRTIAKVELVFSLLLLGVIGLIWAKSAPFIEPAFLKTIDLSQAFLPYGVVFFALIGLSSIPELRELFGARQGEAFALKRSIIAGTLAAALTTLVFAWAVVGVTGPATSPEALQGLVAALDGQVILLGAFLGLVAVFTSFLVNADNLKRTFIYDFGWNQGLAWAMVAAVPVLLFVSGLTDLIKIIGFVGAVTGGIAGIMVVLIHAKAKIQGQRRPEFDLKISRWLRGFLIGLFILGIIYQISINV